MIKKYIPFLISFLLMAGCGADSTASKSADTSGKTEIASKTKNTEKTENSQADSNINDENNEPENTAVLVVDMSLGNPDGEAEHLISRFDYGYDGQLTVGTLAEGLTKLTGLNFAINDFTSEKGGASVDWSLEASFLAGLGDIKQRQEFFVYDSESLTWLMLDSLYRSIIENFGDPELPVYYSMDGWKTLKLKDMSFISEIPPDLQYMGSPFFFAHSDVKGEDDNVTQGDPPENTIQADPPEEGFSGEASWWGFYLNESDNKSLNISNFNGSSFSFQLNAIDGDTFEGSAAVDGNVAEYMDLVFVYNGDEISVTLSEQRDDSYEREIFVDLYYRTYN